MKRFVVLFLVLVLFIPVAFSESNDVADVSWWDGNKVQTKKLPLQVNDKYVYAELPDGTIAIVFYFGDEKTADIATSFPGKTISSINEGAFYFSLELTGKDKYKVGDTIYQCQAGKKLTRIIVPDTVKYLDNYWLECSSWHHYIGYNIPEQLQYAGNNSLSYLQISEIPLFHDVVFPEGWQFFAVSSDVLTFEQGYNSIPAYWCQWFKGKKIIIPEGVTTIGEAAFTYSGNLKDITLPASLTSIADDAFSGCDPKAVFTVFTGTYAEQWANEHGYKTKVLVPVTEITLNEESATINKGKSLTLKATVEPKEATSKKVEWISTDPNVATAKDGKVQAKGCGSCDIICRAADGSGVQAVCHVSVIQMVSSLKVNPQKLTIPYSGTGEVEVTLKPEDATNKTLAWTSSDESICIVDENGKITAVGAGDCEIVCATTDGSNKSAKIKIHVPLFDTTKADYTVTEKIGLLIPVDLRGFSVADITHKSSSDKYFLYYFDTKGLHIIPVAEGAAKITLTCKLNKQDKIVYNVAVDKSALYDYTNITDEQNEYIFDKATSEFHYPSCPKADLIDNGNRGTFTGKRVELIRQFYNPCSECNIFLNDIPQVQVDYPKKLEPEGYNGPECWLLYESECSTKNTKIYKVYAKINTKDNNWHNQVKEVMKMLAQELENHDEYFVTMINIVNNMDEQYPNDIALWNSYPSNPRNKEKSPELVWYPNGSSMHADFTIEQWSP